MWVFYLVLALVDLVLCVGFSIRGEPWRAILMGIFCVFFTWQTIRNKGDKK
jgi:hypothetical protein